MRTFILDYQRNHHKWRCAIEFQTRFHREVTGTCCRDGQRRNRDELFAGCRQRRSEPNEEINGQKNKTCLKMGMEHFSKGVIAYIELAIICKIGQLKSRVLVPGNLFSHGSYA